MAPHIQFRFEVTTTAGHQYDSGILEQPYTPDLAPEQVHDIVVDRFMENWDTSGLFVMAGLDDQPVFLNIAHIEAIRIRWVNPIVIEEASHIPDETEPPPAGEVAGGGVAADYAESAE